MLLDLAAWYPGGAKQSEHGAACQISSRPCSESRCDSADALLKDKELREETASRAAAIDPDMTECGPGVQRVAHTPTHTHTHPHSSATIG